jgi:hypothetical protein
MKRRGGKGMRGKNFSGRAVNPNIVSAMNEFTYQIKIMQASYDATSGQLVLTFSGSGYSLSQYYMQPYNQYYFPAMVTNILKNYQQFCIPAFRIRFRTRVGTSAAGMMTCAYFKDPEYFQASGTSNATGAIIPQQLDTASTCGQWPIWKNMDCPWHFSPKWMYTDGANLNAVYNFDTVAATERQTTAGVYGFYSVAGTTDLKGVTFGDIYLDMVVRGRYMATPAVAAVPKPTLGDLNEKVKLLTKQVEALQSDDLDEKDLVRVEQTSGLGVKMRGPVLDQLVDEKVTQIKSSDGRIAIIEHFERPVSRASNKSK